MDDFPVPIRFHLPGPAWQAVPRDFGGIRNALFVALRPDTPGDYTPVLSLSGGWRTDDASMEQIADECAVRLQEETGDSRVLDRRTVGTEQSPGVSQILRSATSIDGRPLTLARLQAILGFVDPAQPEKRAVLVVGVTCADVQVETVSGEFEQLVRGLRVDERQQRA